MSDLKPIYTDANCRVAYQLHWSVSVFWRSPSVSPEAWLEALTKAMKTDGVRILEHRPKADRVTQFLVSSRVKHAPSQIVRSVKGRLQYLLRDRIPKAFQRNYSILSLGSVQEKVISNYVASQLAHHRMADVRVEERLRRHQVHNRDVDLTKVLRSGHGEYLSNLHLVFVRRDRERDVGEKSLTDMHSMIQQVADKRGLLLSRAGILADHVHLVLGGGVNDSPQDIAMSYMNNLAYAHGMKRWCEYSYYAGTFGNYDLGAVRSCVEGETSFHGDKPSW